MKSIFLQIGIVFIIVAIAVILLGFRAFFTKRGFPNIHIGGNREMKKRGIDCYTAQDRKEQKDK